MSACAWDGTSYDRISGIQLGWGETVVERLALEGEETVLDAGCGSGRVTEILARRLPRGRVIGLDASASMVAAARERLNGVANAEVRQGDLLDLELTDELDAVISTATFHWIADHERLFSGIHRALHRGGRFVAQCGGRGNIDVLRGHAREVMARDSYRAAFADWRSPWNYATAEDTQSRLVQAGFSAVRCWLEPSPQEPDEPREFLRTIVLGPHIQHLRESLREPFLDEVMAEIGAPVVIDYVRLNLEARA